MSLRLTSWFLSLLLLASGTAGCSSTARLYAGPERPRESVAALKLAQTWQILDHQGNIVAASDSAETGSVRRLAARPRLSREYDTIELLPGRYTLRSISGHGNVSLREPGLVVNYGTVYWDCSMSFEALAGRTYVERIRGGGHSPIGDWKTAAYIVEVETDSVVCRCVDD